MRAVINSTSDDNRQLLAYLLLVLFCFVFVQIIATNRMKTILGGVRNAASAIEEEDAAGEDADRV